MFLSLPFCWTLCKCPFLTVCYHFLFPVGRFHFMLAIGGINDKVLTLFPSIFFHKILAFYFGKKKWKSKYVFALSRGNCNIFSLRKEKNIDQFVRLFLGFLTCHRIFHASGLHTVKRGKPCSSSSSS